VNTRPIRTLLGAALLHGLCAASSAQSAPDTAAPDDAAAAGIAQAFAIHGQLTYGQEFTDGFHAPYAGTNSLTPAISRETTDATLFLGVRLWKASELWVEPEIDQGFGLDNTVGVAGFPSGLAYKVGANSPYFRLPRVFVRQTINDAGPTERVDAGAGQLAGAYSLDRWVITIGKFAVTDVFDTNQYAHDPRADFINWAIVDTGTFDYAADAWGYTVGASAERYSGAWTVRAGVFDLSDVPNSQNLEHGLHEFQLVGELERRYPLFGQTGRLLLTIYDTRGRMAVLDEANAVAVATGTIPNPATVRRYRSRFGAGLDLEQPISGDFGLFVRAGRAAGNVEAYEFTDIDRTVALGGALKGARWHRPDDTVGLALLDDGISAEREQYLNLGGLGILVGDGKLPHPGAEQILETYYNLELLDWLHLNADYQWVRNPAYNTDRGPASIFGLRVHAQF
jgi:high affinity Mn2+ porin